MTEPDFIQCAGERYTDARDRYAAVYEAPTWR